jgi:hypothetical protein
VPFRFRVRGVVREKESGRGLPGLTVRAYDRDIVLDDDLGGVATDDAGGFELVFTEPQFQELFETRPDLYLRVFDPAGRLVHSTEDAIRWDAHVEERYEIAISRARLAPPSH